MLSLEMRSINWSISSERHIVYRLPSLVGCEYMPSLTPAHHFDSLAVNRSKTWGTLRSEVFLEFFCMSSPRHSLQPDDYIYIQTMRCKMHKLIQDSMLCNHTSLNSIKRHEKTLNKRRKNLHFCTYYFHGFCFHYNSW